MKKIYIIILFALFACMACQREKEEINPLVGTTWKLAGFVDTQIDTIETPEHDCEHCFLLKFHEDGTLSGYTSANGAEGTYEMNTTSQSLTISFATTTEIMEAPDGLRYIECLNKVTSYTLSGNSLNLYYSPTNYLFFNSYTP
jgi:hypothetical protein